MGKKILALAGFLIFLAGARFQSPALQSAGYVAPGACSACHREIVESYAQTGMARSFSAMRPKDTLELPAANFYHEASEEFFTVLQRDGGSYLERHQIAFDGNVTPRLDARMDYRFGSGNHARTYISRTKSGELVELPLTWYSENGGAWAMSPGYDRPDHGGFSRRITYRCMFCHNAYPQNQTADDWEGSTRFPDRLPEGIDCQRCHGPGQAHLDAVRQRLPVQQVRRAIVNPARLSPERRMEVCLQCHLETTNLKLPATLLRTGRGVFSYRPGEPLENYILHFDRAAAGNSDNRFEFAGTAYRFLQSPCYVKSQGGLSCTNCHNPHEPSNTAAAALRYVEVCRTCHETSMQKLVAEGGHPDSKDCVGCHMPKRRPSDAIHVMVTDHFIQRRPPRDPAGPLIEKNDSNTAPYRGRVVLYYPSTLEKTQENELALALAQVEHQANLDEGLPELERIVTRYTPPRAELYFKLGEGYRHAGFIDKAIASYQQAASLSPADWRYFYALGTASTAAGYSDRAMAALERARSLTAKEPVVLEALANLFARRGRLREAYSTLQAAIAADPDTAGIRINLGARLLQLGDINGAEKAWREALRLRPESATLRINLTNLLASRGDFAEAQYHFRAAVRIDPNHVGIPETANRLPRAK